MTAHDQDVIGEGTNVDFFEEARFLCLGFECLNPISKHQRLVDLRSSA